MATRLLRSLITTANQTLTPRFTTTTTTSVSILRIRPLVAAATNLRHASLAATSIRAFSTRQTTSSLKDSNPNWSNRPPKETILLDGCDFEHWLVVMETPEGEPTRDEIIDSYINTLAKVVGSYDEARMKIYSVSTRCYYAFGALVSEELSYKLKELPGVRWVLPDSYLDVKNKDYGGEPFIDGKAVPYDPKYHAEWIRNNDNAIWRNARPRNDRPRNFERRRENIQNNRLPPGGTMGGPPRGPSNAVAPPPSGNVGGMQQGGGMRGPPYAGAGQSNWGAPHSSYNGGPSNNNTGGWMPPPNNTGGGVPPPNNNTAGWMPPNGPSYQQPQRYGPNNGGATYQAGPRPNGPGYQQPQRYGQNNGSAPYQAGPGPNGYAPNGGGGKLYQNQDIQGRDMPAPPNYSQNYQ